MQVSDYPLRKEIKISNVVCTANLNQPVDIASFNNYQYLHSDLSLYRCGYVKDNKMIGRVTVFGNGKLISVGTKSPDQSERELIRASKILKKYHLIKSCTLEPMVRNIVASASLNKNFNLIKLAMRLPRCIYEPEQFPAAIYKIHESIVALIFASGKVIIVGTKTLTELNRAYFELQQLI